MGASGCSRIPLPTVFQLPQLITLQNEGRGGFFLPRHLYRQVFNFKQEKSHQVFEAPGGQLMLPVKCLPWGALLPWHLPNLESAGKLQDKILRLQVYCIFIEFRPLGNISCFFPLLLFFFLLKSNLHSKKSTDSGYTAWYLFTSWKPSLVTALRWGHRRSAVPKEVPLMPSPVTASCKASVSLFYIQRGTFNLIWMNTIVYLLGSGFFCFLTYLLPSSLPAFLLTSSPGWTWLITT